MDFQLTEEEREIQRQAHRFSLECLRPNAERMDAMGEVPGEVVRRFHELELHSLLIPEEFGGCGRPPRCLDFLIAVEELGWGDAGAAVHLIGSAMCYLPIVLAGTEEQKRRFLPRFIGKEFYQASMAATEPDAGSDVFGMRTIAVPDQSGGYRLSGQKCFITNAPVAELLLVWATVDPSEGPAGIRGFLIERDTPGLTIGKPYKKLGVRASTTAPLYLEEVRVPKENVIGGRRTAMIAQRKMLERSKITGSAIALGVSRAAFEDAKAYAKQRVLFGKSIYCNQAVSHRIVDMAIDIERCRLLIYKAATYIDAGKDAQIPASMAKAACGSLVRDTTLNALHVFGGYGFMEDNPVAKYYRDAPIFDIWEGTGDIQREILAARI